MLFKHALLKHGQAVPFTWDDRPFSNRLSVRQSLPGSCTHRRKSVIDQWNSERRIPTLTIRHRAGVCGRDALKSLPHAVRYSAASTG